MSARPAPGTTELLEVLDRVLGGGLVIDAGPRKNVVGFATPGVVARLVVAGIEPYLHDGAPESASTPGTPPEGERPKVGALPADEPLPKRRHG